MAKHSSNFDEWIRQFVIQVPNPLFVTILAEKGVQRSMAATCRRNFRNLAPRAGGSTLRLKRSWRRARAWKRPSCWVVCQDSGPLGSPRAAQSGAYPSKSFFAPAQRRRQKKFKTILKRGALLKTRKGGRCNTTSRNGTKKELQENSRY